MARDASVLARQLGERAEAVCRHYLANGRRQGNYWLVGDVRNTPGRSMFVRLKDGAKGRTGKWTDAQSGEHGDLLDVIREALGLIDFADVAEEARSFLRLPMPDAAPTRRTPRQPPAPSGSREAARRLFAMAQPLGDTLVETYLRKRGITALHGADALRFHPRCYYRPDDDGPTETWPAMIAAVADLSGRQTGTHRTWLAADGSGKAPIATQRKAMGDLLGNAVRFGVAGSVLAAGEGIETMLSLRSVLPAMPMAAALSAALLSALLFGPDLRRLYIVRDDDSAGDMARDALVERAQAAGIEAIVLSPVLGDFNDDLRHFGIDALRAQVRVQVAPEDVARFMALAAQPEGTDAAGFVMRPLPLLPIARSRDLGLPEGDRPSNGPGTQWQRPVLFRRRVPRLCIARQNNRASPSSALLRPRALLRVQARPARRLSSPEGREGRGRTDGKPSMDAHDEPHHEASSTDHVLQELQLYGYRPFQDEPDPRPLPEGAHVAGAIADIFDALIATLEDTRLEPDLDDLLWSTVNLFHRAVSRIERDLDDNEQAQRRGQREQDGSEVKSVELERLTAEGQTLLERRDAFELMRDQAADQYERQTRSPWRPRAGSMVNHRNLTAAMIDSRDFLAAKRRAETEVLLPVGPKIAFTGGDTDDARPIWAKLDQIHAKYPDMVLLHGGSPKGAEKAAARWADHRKVPQVAFKPDWTKHAKAAPFKRNDAMLNVLPIGIVVWPGTGIQDNLADKARKLGIPVWRFDTGGA